MTDYKLVHVERGALEKALAVICHLDPTLQYMDEESFRSLSSAYAESNPAAPVAGEPVGQGLEYKTPEERIEWLKADRAAVIAERDRIEREFDVAVKALEEIESQRMSMHISVGSLARRRGEIASEALAEINGGA